MTVFAGRAYNEIRVGESFADTQTLTETHLVQSAQLFGDYHPVHVDETFAAGTRFGGRIFHGYFTSSLMAAAAGMFFAGTGEAYLEHSCRFTAAVRPGDTLTSRWTIVDMIDKPHRGGGIVVLKGTCRNQRDELVAEADARLLVKNKPFYT